MHHSHAITLLAKPQMHWKILCRIEYWLFTWPNSLSKWITAVLFALSWSIFPCIISQYTSYHIYKTTTSTTTCIANLEEMGNHSPELISHLTCLSFLLFLHITRSNRTCHRWIKLHVEMICHCLILSSFSICTVCWNVIISFFV